MQAENAAFRSGFAALVGRANVGKSTLVNALIGRKVVIVSDKPQTTRTRIRAVLTLPHAQLILVDTPGMHKPRHRLGEMMVSHARAALAEVDLILYVVDLSAPVGPQDRYIAGVLREAQAQTPVILVGNKADLLAGTSEAEEPAQQYQELVPFDDLAVVSAATGQGLDRLLEQVIQRLPEGPRYFPEGQVTDQPEAFLIAELVREKVLELTREEVPHSVAVVVEAMRHREDRPLTEVEATVYVERPSQKGILIGKGGQRLKEIGQRARLEIEALLGVQVFLNLWVKVKEDWRDREGALRALGYRPPEEE